MRFAPASLLAFVTILLVSFAACSDSSSPMGTAGAPTDAATSGDATGPAGEAGADSGVAPACPSPNATGRSVDPSGGGDFTTIQACLDAVKPGENCIVQGGSYAEHLAPTHSGSYSAPIRIIAAAGAEVDVDGLSLDAADFVRVEGLRFRTLSQWGISWSFDAPTEAGVYANGDFWVVGPVRVTAITPDFNGAHHGWDVNPVFAGPQGYEAGAGSFDATVVPALPYMAMPGQSIVKSMSTVTDPTNTADCYGKGCLKTAAVLTVVTARPEGCGEGLFRPPYAGADKTSYAVASLHTELLPSLAPVKDTPTLSAVATSMRRVQLDHKGGETGRNLRPTENLPDYGSDVAIQINEAILRVMLNDPLADKMAALVYVVQAGIDRYHAVLAGQTWPDGGGHEPGRKVSIAFAAAMLGDAAMKDKVSKSTFFNEDEGLFVGARGTALFGFSTFDLGEAAYWDYVKNDPGYNLERPDPYGFIDGGMNEVRDVDGYQTCCLSLPWQASALAGMLMPDIKGVWNAKKFFDYADRWMNVGVWTEPDPCAAVSQGGGPDGNGGCILDPDLTAGSTMTNFSCQAGKECGRYPARHGTYAGTGLHGSSFSSEMWTAYRGTVP